MKQTLYKSSFFAALLAGLVFLVVTAGISAQRLSPYALAHKPPDASPALKQYVGDYGPDDAPYIVLEDHGRLILRKPDGAPGGVLRRASTYMRTGVVPTPLDGSDVDFLLPDFPAGQKTGRIVPVHFSKVGSERASSISLAGLTLPRRKLDPDEGQSFRIQPARSIDQLRQEALSASPPDENGQFRTPDLVDLAAVDPSIHLDIRYATSNDFLGTPVYTQARAFLQRPAADALLRALHRLKPYGYALLIHDAYRPWYVTKIFWDATPPEGKIFVADPKEGSRHNRGCAVDLTLYELQTGKPIQMPGTYDEMSPRSFPDYPGGTSLQRWHRDLLRWAMESEGFTVYEHEWWHFDYKDWREYPILNVPFEKLQFSEKQVR
jgi:D-alanyl-D-alanine dipeptidase